VATTTTVFSGTLGVGESRFHTFATVATATANATLASLTTSAGDVLFTSVTLSLGQPSDDNCAAIASATARPGFVSQISASVSAGTYCVSVSDPGNLSGPVKYSVRVVHP
jgi:hypothetical protein